MTSKVLFIDMDGVIVTDKSNVGTIDKTGFPCIPDKSVINLINKICENTGAKIVISSMWRTFFTELCLKMFLRSHGINGKYFHDDFYTKDFGGTIARGFEITEWLERHLEVTKYVVIDDLPDIYFDGFTSDKDHTQFFIQTKAYEGLTYTNYMSAIEILGLN
jgi:hypothetical protein